MRSPMRSPTRPSARGRPTSAATRSATRAARRRSFAPSAREDRRHYMRITITGASGLIGTKLGAALKQRGDEVIPVSLRDEGPIEIGDAVVHLAGENVAQRWTDAARERIEQSRVQGTRKVVEAINRIEENRPPLISASAVGYYGPRGDETVDEDTPPGDDFLAQACIAWENEA